MVRIRPDGNGLMNFDTVNTTTTVALVRAPLLSRVGALNNEAVPHIGLAYLAGAVRAVGHSVAIIDGTAEGLNGVHPWPGHPGFQLQGITLDDLVARIPAAAEVIGFTSMFSAEWVLMRELIGKVRERFADALLVAGGEHFTALPAYSLDDCPALDVIVKGEGEATLLHLIEAWQTGDISEVEGICLTGRRIISSSSGPPGSRTGSAVRVTSRCSRRAVALTVVRSVRVRRCGRRVTSCVTSKT